ncbi:helix-turn-helix domain-containing protein [Telmatobacter sp. DSM 110680]|uniref:Helix-turn-helix domain-containing protein n=1 Tax=Telmatobacter sp. DSM 110680 TaxID=3036704 RepID=A0AAU7DN74_9BACT
MKQDVRRIASRKPEAARISGVPSLTTDNLISEKRLIKHEPHISSCGSEPSTKGGGSRRILTPVLAAQLFGCDDKTITRWARDGYIPAHPIGTGKKNYWRFFEDELIDWLMDQKNGALAA